MNRREFLLVLGAGPVVLALSACQPTPAAPSSAGQSSGGPQPALGLPIVSAPLTLTYWVPMAANVVNVSKSFGDLACYQELEKRTGIHLEFQHPPFGSEVDQFNLLVSSGKYPDIIEYSWLTGYAGGPAKAIRDGVIVRLNDLIDRYAPNLKKVLADRPELRRQVVTDEGDMYVFPFLHTDAFLLTVAGPALRADWLDKLGLKPPTTLDEWHTTLTAFKSGYADAQPFSPWFMRDPGYDWFQVGAFIQHAFVGAWGLTMRFYQDQGAVRYGPLQPEFKDFLGTMVTWYREGLIDPDFVTTDQKGLDAKVTADRLGSMMLLAGGGIGKYAALMRTTEPSFKLVGAPYPVLHPGDTPLLGQRDNPYSGPGSAAISTANKHLAETVRLLDYGYSPEGVLLFNFGIQGQSYTLEANGYPRYTAEVMNNPQGLPPAQAMVRYSRANFPGPYLQDPRGFEQFENLPEQQAALKAWAAPTDERQLPPTTATQEESRRFASVMTDVESRVREVFTRVLTGAEPLTSWDGLAPQLRQIGIDDALKVQQAALDRYNTR